MAYDLDSVWLCLCISSLRQGWVSIKIAHSGCFRCQMGSFWVLWVSDELILGALGVRWEAWETEDDLGPV